MKYLFSIYKYSLLILAFYVLVQCENKSSIPPPSDLIDEKMMGRIIADALLIENKLSSSNMKQYSQLLLTSYPILDEKYHLKDSQAYKSYHYYIQQPEKLDRIIKIALDTLDILAKQTPEEIKE